MTFRANAPSSGDGFLISEDDLKSVSRQLAGLLPALRNARVLLTGASGFVGAWLIESLLWVNAEHDLQLEVTVLARNASRFQNARRAWQSHARLRLIETDVVSGPLPMEEFDFFIHGAAETNVRLDQPDPTRMFLASVIGTQRILDLAAQSKAPRFLLLSSGAVYGRQPTDVDRVSETHLIGPDCISIAQAYGHGKRAAEFLVSSYSAQSSVHGVSARAFAFSGAYLPLDSGFAIGNFVADAMARRPICIRSDGSARRSYMYGSDMAVWLWTILLRGRRGAIYNVGAEASLSILELAQHVAEQLGVGDSSPVKVLGKQLNALPERYVPDTSLARGEMGLRINVDLDDGIRRMGAWNQLYRP